MTDRTGARHRVVGCPLCLAPYTSTTGLRQHVPRAHAQVGQRGASLVVELSVARAKGWPTERFERELRVLVERGQLPAMLEVRA